MPATKRFYVIDSSVARSAGKDDTKSDMAKRCSKLLKCIRGFRRWHVVFNRQLLEEWKKHRSETASNWMTLMESRGRIERCDDKQRFLKWLDQESIEILPERTRKDLHLLDAALYGDGKIFSTDTYIVTDMERHVAAAWESMGIRVFTLCKPEDCTAELGRSIE